MANDTQRKLVPPSPSVAAHGTGATDAETKGTTSE